MTEFMPAVNAVASRRQTLTALSKVADPEVAKAAALSLKQLTAVEKQLRDLDNAERERTALKALYDAATDTTTRVALKNAMVARSLVVLGELVTRDKATRR